MRGGGGFGAVGSVGVYHTLIGYALGLYRPKTFAKKWKRAAKVFDRFFLLVFSIVYLYLVAYLLSSM